MSDRRTYADIHKSASSALEEIRTPNLLIRSNHAYCDVLNEVCAVQPTGRGDRTRNSQMLSVRRPRALYGATYGARSINGVAQATECDGLP